MKTFDVQGIEVMATRDQVFEFVREPGNLPRWAQAFESAGGGRARLETPAGAVDIALDVSADAGAGTVDWRLTFPDGGAGLAQSRVTETTRGTCLYSFVLHAPPVALEQRSRLAARSGCCSASTGHTGWPTSWGRFVDFARRLSLRSMPTKLEVA